MRRDPDCLFCRIVKGEIPSAKVYEDETVLAFRDINPAAPTHVLVVPRDHVATLAECGDGDRDILADVMLAAGKVAGLEKLDSFRLIVNNGAGAGQTVFHLHAHVLGGKPMGEKLL
jgi:histidine triad (HIT) family protein